MLYRSPLRLTSPLVLKFLNTSVSWGGVDWKRIARGSEIDGYALRFSGSECLVLEDGEIIGALGFDRRLPQVFYDYATTFKRSATPTPIWVFTRHDTKEKGLAFATRIGSDEISWELENGRVAI